MDGVNSELTGYSNGVNASRVDLLGESDLSLSLSPSDYRE